MLSDLEKKCLQGRCDWWDMHILREVAEMEKKGQERFEINSDNKIDLLCNAQIATNADGEIVIDLRKTKCDPEKVKNLVESITKKAKTRWKMPTGH